MDENTQKERRWVTVMFTDISGYTALSEQMDPEDVMELSDRLTRRMSEIIRRFDGTVLGFGGDGVLAVFGAPVTHEDDAERAVRAAIAIRELDLSSDPTRPLQVHIGINTGEVMTGLAGPREVRSYNVIGDVVNTAARLRDAAPRSGGILVGTETYRATRDIARYRDVPAIAAKGKEQPVQAWEALEVIALPGTRRQGTAPLFGRDDDLTHLENMWQRVAQQAQPHLVTVLGEAGIGKSRLVAEFERRLPPEVVVWHGRCLPYGEALAYWALSLALKEAAGITAEDGPNAARTKLERLVGDALESEENPAEVARHLALLAGLDVATDRLEGAVDQRLLHASLRLFVEGFARKRPLCLILDDIHWADEALLDLIETVAGRARGVPLLIVTQSRPELMETRSGWPRGVRSYTSLFLNPLSEELEQQLLLALSQEWGLTAEVARELGRSAGGNPLFAEQLVAMVAESGTAARVPSLIKMLISARLDGLPPNERHLLQMASIFGKVFWASGLRALDPSLNGHTSDQLDLLEEKDLIRSQPRSQFRGDREYSFKHDLIRDVAYEILPKATRRVLHSYAVDWLETAAGEQIEAYFDQLAHHAIEAEQQERAISYLMQAAERATRAAAHRQAAALLGQAIAIAQPLGQQALLASLYARRGKAYMGVFMGREAMVDLEAALAALGSERLEQRAEVLVDLAETYFWLLDIASVRRHASEALTLAKEAGRDDLVAAATIALGGAEGSDGNLWASLEFYERAERFTREETSIIRRFPHLSETYYWLGRYEAAVPKARADIEKAHGDIAMMIMSLQTLGLSLAGMGYYDQATPVFEEAKRLGREFEVHPLLARAHAVAAGFHLDVYDFAGNEALAEEARELARSISFVPTIVSAGIDLLFNYARRQEVGPAEKLIADVAEDIHNAAGFHAWLWRLRFTQAQAEIALARSDWEEALRLGEDAAAQGQARGRVKYQALGFQTRAKALTALGRTREAIADLQRAVELARPTGDPAMLLRPATALLALDGDDLLLAEARAAADRIRAALPDEEMRHRFEEAEPVRQLGRIR